MRKSDELRSRVVELAREFHQAAANALERIRNLTHAVDQLPPNQWHVAGAYRKAVSDALAMLRPVQETGRQYEQWLAEVMQQDPDACGLTAEEREKLRATKAA